MNKKLILFGFIILLFIYPICSYAVTLSPGIWEIYEGNFLQDRYFEVDATGTPQFSNLNVKISMSCSGGYGGTGQTSTGGITDPIENVIYTNHFYIKQSGGFSNSYVSRGYDIEIQSTQFSETSMAGTLEASTREVIISRISGYDDMFCSGSKTRHWAARKVDTPVVEFHTNNINGLAPMTVEFRDQSSGYITEWVWDFGDGTTSVEQHPTHTYTKQGVYDVKLYVNGPAGENETIKQKLINTGFLANFEYTQDQSNPLKMHFSDTSIGEEASWEWDFGDGNTSTSQHPTHTFDTPGRFNITLTISKGEWSSKYSKYILISVSGYRLISSYDLQGKEVWYSKNGKFAYAATNSWFIETDHTLDLLSLEDPSNIKLLSKIVFDNEKNLENKILDVTELKNRIFVHHACKGQYYLSVIDSSTPQSPIILHEIPVDKGLFDVQNSYIYLVTINDDGFLHVTVFDITNEITQIISQPFEEHQPYTLFDMALNGNTAWLMLKSDETKYALVPLDVSDSTNIALLPHEEIEKGSSYDNFGKIVIEQDIAYVMTGNYYDNLFIVDVSNPRNIQYYKEIPGLWPIL